MFPVALSIAPGLAICIYIIYRNIHKREPALILVISFVLGMIATIPAVLLELLTDRFKYHSIPGIILSTFFFIALVEESCKFLPLRFYAFNRKTFDEPLDGIVYSIIISMGFATVENLAYVFLNQDNGYSIGLMRMFTSVPAHACFAIIMGYYTGKAKFNIGQRQTLLIKGLLGATLAHGIYDSFLFLNQSTWLRQYLSETDASLVFFAAAIFFLYVCIHFCRKLIQMHFNESRLNFTQKAALTTRYATPRDIETIRQLAMEIWPQTYSAILSTGQIDYMLNKMYSTNALTEQFENNHRFIIAYSNEKPVGFASFSETAPSLYKLHKIYVLANQQGRGTGSNLIQKVILEISTQKQAALQLNVNRQNSARAFYEKIGFKIIRSEDIDIGEGFLMNDYVMEKQLDQA